VVFAVAAIVATKMDNHAYNTVYAKQNIQKKHIEKTLYSEFISNSDANKLERKLYLADQTEKKISRRKLLKMIEREKSLLFQVQGHISKTEAKVAKVEAKQIAKQLMALEKQSKELFISDSDIGRLTDLKARYAKLGTPRKVAPVRSLSAAISKESDTMATTQDDLKEMVNDLKNLNKEAEALQKSKFLNTTDKAKLKVDAKENTAYFKDASNWSKITTRKTDSESLHQELQTKQQQGENDIKTYSDRSKKLSQFVTNLMSAGNLNESECNDLVNYQKDVEDDLNFKDYTPGDLEKSYKALKSKYDYYLVVNNKRAEGY
jgi:hypothetical protein